MGALADEPAAFCGVNIEKGSAMRWRMGRRSSNIDDRRGQGGFSGFGDDSYRPDRSAQGHGTPTDAAPASPAETTLVLPDGVLVDVLA